MQIFQYSRLKGSIRRLKVVLTSSGDINRTTLISNTEGYNETMGDNEDVRVAHMSCPVSRRNRINGLAD